jgi:hypothetical protein
MIISGTMAAARVSVGVPALCHPRYRLACLPPVPRRQSHHRIYAYLLSKTSVFVNEETLDKPYASRK